MHGSTKLHEILTLQLQCKGQVQHLQAKYLFPGGINDAKVWSSESLTPRPESHRSFPIDLCYCCVHGSIHEKGQNIISQISTIFSNSRTKIRKSFLHFNSSKWRLTYLEIFKHHKVTFTTRFSSQVGHLMLAFLINGCGNHKKG